MKILLACIGKAGRESPEHALYAHYCKRLPWKLALKEIEFKKPLPIAQRKAQEAQALLEASKGYAIRIVLDEKGKTLSTLELAKQIADWQVQGNSSLAFLIGGSDGHGDAALKAATLTLSLGRATWPHLLVRALVAEQLYRCHSLHTGHPYHRE